MMVRMVMIMLMVMMVMMVLARPRQVGGSLKLELYGSSLADLALLCHHIQSMICPIVKDMSKRLSVKKQPISG